jgi:hypothetical protein
MTCNKQMHAYSKNIVRHHVTIIQNSVLLISKNNPRFRLLSKSNVYSLSHTTFSSKGLVRLFVNKDDLLYMIIVCNITCIL